MEVYYFSVSYLFGLLLLVRVYSFCTASFMIYNLADVLTAASMTDSYPTGIRGDATTRVHGVKIQRSFDIGHTARLVLLGAWIDSLIIS